MTLKSMQKYAECLHQDGKFDESDCPDCCEHELDSSEGYTCLNCGTEGLEHMADQEDWRKER